MIEIFIQTDTGVTAQPKVKAVPRVGEHIDVRGVEYRVTKVLHTIGDRFTNQTISVFADEVKALGCTDE
jgi:hypothetical protein